MPRTSRAGALTAIVSRAPFSRVPRFRQPLPERLLAPQSGTQPAVGSRTLRGRGVATGPRAAAEQQHHDRHGRTNSWDRRSSSEAREREHLQAQNTTDCRSPAVQLDRATRTCGRPRRDRGCSLDGNNRCEVRTSAEFAARDRSAGKTSRRPACRRARAAATNPGSVCIATRLRKSLPRSPISPSLFGDIESLISAWTNADTGSTGMNRRRRSMRSPVLIFAGLTD